MSDISATAGSTIEMAFGPVVVGDPPAALNLRTPGMKLRFIAKRRKTDDDADAEWDLVYDAGLIEDQGIAVPDVGDRNEGTVVVDGAATRDLTQAIDLMYELILVEPDDKVTRLDQGRIRISTAVLHAAP